MAVATSTIETDGRALTVSDAGDPGGAPILFHHEGHLTLLLPRPVGRIDEWLLERL